MGTHTRAAVQLYCTWYSSDWAPRLLRASVARRRRPGRTLPSLDLACMPCCCLWAYTDCWKSTHIREKNWSDDSSATIIVMPYIVIRYDVEMVHCPFGAIVTPSARVARARPVELSSAMAPEV